MTVLITGASGNLGGKLRRHLAGRYTLRLLDLHGHGDKDVVECDLSRWDSHWVNQFRGVKTVVHLAADPTAQQTWPLLIAPNVDAMINCYQAAILSGVERFIYASSNHVMGGYKDDSQTPHLTTDLPPRPGAHYVVHGEVRDSSAYAAGKLFGERLGKCYSESSNLSVIAVRIGWVQAGPNRPNDIPTERDPWFRLMWLSNRDYCQLMEKCIGAESSLRFAIINGMSKNTGMVWDIEHTKQMVGYEPLDDVMQQ